MRNVICVIIIDIIIVFRSCVMNFCVYTHEGDRYLGIKCVLNRGEDFRVPIRRINYKE